ncbi:multicopper oxidase family protein [Occallatibacter riparius]|uniref:Multicopper oxidase n=1 Tax=Occallatibacter riparius TaxID=1002689 RepID=A0A9J7BN46_9BACT|nr:multicopper oxidase [Occallatibacter riparius]UWZ84055.1 multicopper oxidase [Occallatibacter riparius]
MDPSPAMSRAPIQVERFLDRLPIPRRIVPYGTKKGVKLYRVRAAEFTARLHSQLPAARLWGYDRQYPGPVFEALQGEPIEVEWENGLPQRHLFQVDRRIHGAMAPVPEVRMVPHLHGARTESESDGLPEKWFTPGESRRYSYPNEQRAATLWYHDHALGITRLNVYAGLSGFYLLRDREEMGMDLPKDDYEIPLLLQDRTVDASGVLLYLPTHEDGKELPPGQWGPEFFGNLPVVNGAIAPYLEVEPRPYRFRVLNGANARFFELTFNLGRDASHPSLVDFQQIGTDGGLLPAPASLNRLLLGPAERADIVVDFSRHAGRTLTLQNSAWAPYPGWTMFNIRPQPVPELMQFRVSLPVRPNRAAVNVKPVAFARLDEKASVRTRDFVLSERVDGFGRSLGVRIDGKGYDDPVSETVKLGTVETWRFINTTDDAHPMHLHLVQFQILHRRTFDTLAFPRVLQFVGNPRPPAANEAGWKDTAIVRPNEVLSILVPFEGYAGRYVFHCHMLEHEDNDMMRPYVVVR